MKVNRKLCWMTWKRFEETGDNRHRPRHCCPRTLGDPTRIWLKSQVCSMRPRELYSKRTWICPNSNLPGRINFLFKLLINNSKDPQFFFLAFRMARYQISFSVKKKFDVGHHFSAHDDRVQSRDGDEWSRVVTRKQRAASVMVWAAVTESGRCLFFVDKDVELNQYCWPEHGNT